MSQRAFQQVFSAVGLNSPLLRFGAISILAGGALVALQPESMFTAGVPRAWSLMPQEDDANPPTPVPWYLAATLVGFTAAHFF